VAVGVRIKDVTEFEGARSNQLYGFGLVTGLDRSGSTSLFTQRVAVDMLHKLQVGAKIFQDLPSDNVIRSNSISAVMVTAEIGPFARKGSRIDVTVSALDDARSLQGGTLIFTPLRGADGEVYVTAQGPLSVGGFLVAGAAAAVQKNHTNVGRIPGGGLVEKEALGEIACNGFLRLLLREPDYNTAQAIARAINAQYPHAALPIDGGTVQVAVPKSRCADVVTFAGEIGTLEVNPDFPARVVIDERTGTVVAGEEVRVSRVAVAHGNLSILRVETPEVAQPPPFTQAPPVVVPRTQVGAAEQHSYLQVVPATVSVGSLARALNALGVTPRDLISIFQALKETGALHAELVIM
jgi:flagellar P-ring protein precursor FlgI